MRGGNSTVKNPHSALGRLGTTNFLEVPSSFLGRTVSVTDARPESHRKTNQVFKPTSQCLTVIHYKLLTAYMAFQRSPCAPLSSTADCKSIDKLLCALEPYYCEFVAKSQGVRLSYGVACRNRRSSCKRAGVATVITPLCRPCFSISYIVHRRY